MNYIKFEDKYMCEHEHHHEEEKNENLKKIRIIIAFLIFIITLIANPANDLKTVTYLFAYIISGGDIIIKACQH